MSAASPSKLAQFDAMAAPEGSFLVGDPSTVANKIQHVPKLLGGLPHVASQMTSAASDTAAMPRTIELLGTHVAPAVRMMDASASAREVAPLDSQVSPDSLPVQPLTIACSSKCDDECRFARLPSS